MEALPEDETSLGDIMVRTEDSPTWSSIDAQGIMNEYIKQGYTAKHIMRLPGGEPTVAVLSLLLKHLSNTVVAARLRPSGTSEVKATIDTWVTVSPKVAMKAKLDILDSALVRANEIKHPVGTGKDIEQLDALIARADVPENTVIALQPISQKERATQLCIDTCIERNWRLSIQTHKYLSIA